MTVTDTAPRVASKAQLFSHSIEHGHTYRVIEVVGTSEKGVDDAMRSAIDRAHQTIRGLAWCEVFRITGHIKDGRIEGGLHLGGSQERICKLRISDDHSTAQGLGCFDLFAMPWSSNGTL